MANVSADNERQFWDDMQGLGVPENEIKQNLPQRCATPVPSSRKPTGGVEFTNFDSPFAVRDEIRKAKRDRKEAAARLADRSRRKKLYNYACDQKFAKLDAAAVENIMRAIQDFASKGYSRRKISNIVGMPFSTMQAKYMRWKKERETGETEKAVQKLLDDVRDSGMWSGDETNQQSDEEEKEAAFGTHKLSGSASEQHEHVGVPQELEQPEVLDTESGTPETHTSAAVNSEFQLQHLELLTLTAKVLEAQFMAIKLTAWNKLKGLGVPKDEIEQGLVAFSWCIFLHQVLLDKAQMSRWSFSAKYFNVWSQSEV